LFDVSEVSEAIADRNDPVPRQLTNVEVDLRVVRVAGRHQPDVESAENRSFEESARLGQRVVLEVLGRQGVDAEGVLLDGQTKGPTKFGVGKVLKKNEWKQ
jgi:hypothetical protein